MTAPNVIVHTRLAQQIGHLLRVRVVQELVLLSERLRHRPQFAAAHPVLRKLTRAEFQKAKETGVAEWEGAVALIVVPPLMKDLKTGKRVEASMTPAPPQEEGEVVVKRPPFPPFVMLDVGEKSEDRGTDEEADLLPSPKIPLYNGVSLFPSRPQRAALHEALNKVLSSEVHARQVEGLINKSRSKSGAGAVPSVTEPPQAVADDPRKQPVSKRAKGDAKASHAYLLFSDKHTVLRTDTVPLAIALWRVRMWEGGGWDNPYAQHWKLKPAPIPS